MATKKPTTKEAYEALLPQFQAIYHTLPPEEQDRVAKLDALFHEGQEAGFVSWARSVIRGAFAGWKATKKVEPTETINVDLKWSLWSGDKGTWEDRESGVWARMNAAFTGKGPQVAVQTAPGKEIRSGTVLIEKGRAWVTFSTEWDDAEDLAGNWLEGDAAEADHQRLVKWIRQNAPLREYGGGIGSEAQKEVRAKTFPALMREIDNVEAVLLATDEALFAEIRAHVRKMLIPRITGRRKFLPLPSHGFIEEDEE